MFCKWMRCFCVIIETNTKDLLFVPGSDANALSFQIYSHHLLQLLNCFLSGRIVLCEWYTSLNDWLTGSESITHHASCHTHSSNLPEMLNAYKRSCIYMANKYEQEFFMIPSRQWYETFFFYTFLSVLHTAKGNESKAKNSNSQLEIIEI